MVGLKGSIGVGRVEGGGGARMWLRDAGERVERGRKWGGVAVKLGLG